MVTLEWGQKRARSEIREKKNDKNSLYAMTPHVVNFIHVYKYCLKKCLKGMHQNVNDAYFRLVECCSFLIWKEIILIEGEDQNPIGLSKELDL